MKTRLLVCMLGITFACLLMGGGALAQCATDVHYGLVHCVNEGEETEVDDDTCADPGPPNYFCVQGYGRCTDRTVYHTANAGPSDSCDPGDPGSGGGCVVTKGGASPECEDPDPPDPVDGPDPDAVGRHQLPRRAHRGAAAYVGWAFDLDKDHLPYPLFAPDLRPGASTAVSASAAPDIKGGQNSHDVTLNMPEKPGDETMKIPVFLLAGLCSAAPTLCAQQGAAVNIKASRVELPLTHPAQLIDRVACDGQGNIYARAWAGDGSLTSRLPIQEITPDGALTRSFRATEEPQDGATAKGIFVSGAGRIYETATTARGIYIVEFATDGSVKLRTKLEADPRLVDPWQLAAFESGGYLLSGLTGKQHRTPFTAVFDENGKLVRQIYEPEDEAARQSAENGDREYTRSNAGNNFVGLGDVAAGSDGNVYLLRGTSQSVVYVISPAGSVLRKLRVDAGDGRFAVRSIRSYGDRLAFGFTGPTALVMVTDPRGVSIAKYAMDRRPPDLPVLACYDSKGFTFVTAYAEKELYLLKARPE